MIVKMNMRWKRNNLNAKEAPAVGSPNGSNTMILLNACGIIKGDDEVGIKYA